MTPYIEIQQEWFGVDREERPLTKGNVLKGKRKGEEITVRIESDDSLHINGERREKEAGAVILRKGLGRQSGIVYLSEEQEAILEEYRQKSTESDDGYDDYQEVLGSVGFLLRTQVGERSYDWRRRLLSGCTQGLSDKMLISKTSSPESSSNT